MTQASRRRPSAAEGRLRQIARAVWLYEASDKLGLIAIALLVVLFGLALLVYR
jgi:hypothetical protein